MKFFRKKGDTFDYQLTRTCLTCDAQFQGKFCHTCGEKVVEPYDRSVLHFLDNLLNALTFIDSKFYNSLKALLLKPGTMAADIARGRRVPYMKPVAFFFVGNFIYFFLPAFETFNTTLHWQMNGMPYSAYARDAVESHLLQTNDTLEAFSARYNAESTNWAKIILISLAALMFPFVVLINYTRKTYLSDHFLFSMEYAAFLLFVPTVLFGVGLKAILTVARWMEIDLNFLFADNTIFPVLVAMLLCFLAVGVRNFYNFHWWRVALSTVLLTLSMYVVIHGYRFLLFKTTMWSLS